MFRRTHLLLIASMLLISVVYTHDTAHKCTHDTKNQPEPEVNYDVDELDLQAEGRTLKEFPYIRIKSYTGVLGDQPQEFQDYINNDILPPVLSYFNNLLKINAPLGSALRFSTSQKTICSVPTPAEIYTGVAADFYYIIDASTDTSSNWVADSYACFLSGSIKRPYVAKTVINRAEFPIATGNVLTHEKNMICIMHELTHVLGFSKSLYQYFRFNTNGTRLSGHVTGDTLDGESVAVLNVEPLTSRIRNFFGCSTIKGAMMEGGGGDGTAGSHFERRQFGYEFMTSGLIDQMQVSQFTLALLEGTGWYFPDYSMADPYYFGQGQGCGFLTGACSPSLYDEWCVGSARGCTGTGRGGGECAADIRSNGCRYQHPRYNYDCENEGGINYARLPTVETYGRGAGAKCFMGTLKAGTVAGSTTSLCLKPTCSLSGVDTVLTIKMGASIVKCAKEGPISVPGFAGSLNCPDPVAYCSTYAQKVCPRGCMGRGECIEGQCVCNAGFMGSDCALSVSYGL